METNCQECGAVMNLIPAGTSKKTGKPYNSFMACPNKCKGKWNDKTPRPQKDGVQVLADEIIALNGRMDKLIALLVQKLGQPLGQGGNDLPLP